MAVKKASNTAGKVSYETDAMSDRCSNYLHRRCYIKAYNIGRGNYFDDDPLTIDNVHFCPDSSGDKSTKLEGFDGGCGTFDSDSNNDTIFTATNTNTTRVSLWKCYGAFHPAGIKVILWK